MGSRELTVGEIAMASTVYGNMIDYSKVRIYNEKYWGLQSNDRAMSPNGNIYYGNENVSYHDNISFMAGKPVGTVVRFESNKEDAKLFSAVRTKAEHSFYASDGYFSENAYVWGQSSAGFKGNVTVLKRDFLSIKGEIRPYEEEFDFTPNTYNVITETGRYLKYKLVGPGTGYKRYGALRQVSFGQGVPAAGAGHRAVAAEPEIEPCSGARDDRHGDQGDGPAAAGGRGRRGSVVGTGLKFQRHKFD